VSQQLARQNTRLFFQGPIGRETKATVNIENVLFEIFAAPTHGFKFSL
jgi:hypothetical protein